jgi:hypothetical protein
LAISTGSPASRNSTKFTPFTTRPAVTSKQGMIRFESMNLLNTFFLVYLMIDEYIFNYLID